MQTFLWANAIGFISALDQLLYRCLGMARGLFLRYSNPATKGGSYELLLCVFHCQLPSLLRGAKIVFYRIAKPDHPNMDVSLLEQLISSPKNKGKSSLLHYGGVPCEMEIWSWRSQSTRNYGVEGRCGQGIDSFYQGKSFGEESGHLGKTYSFHETKISSGWEGGCWIINEPKPGSNDGK